MKIAICTPTYGSVRTDFYYSAMSLLGYTLQTMQPPGAIQIATLVADSCDVAFNRNELAKTALELGADWILWADSDHRFPRDALLRLMKHNVDIVGVNQPRRGFPIRPTTEKDGKLLLSTAQLAKSEPLQKVDHTGFGFCLIRRAVFDALAQPYFEGAHEDVSFSKRVRDKGFDVWVDHALSMDVGHVGEHVFTFPR
jgi:hypothetical protein